MIPQNKPDESTLGSDKPGLEQLQDSLSPEVTQEILEKAVDIFQTEGLKYKQPFDAVSLFLIAESGLISTEAAAPTAKEIGAKWKSVSGEAREQQKNNVFYPEANLVFLRQYLTSEVSVADFENVKEEHHKKSASYYFGSNLLKSFIVLRSLLSDNRITLSDSEKEVLDPVLRDLASQKVLAHKNEKITEENRALLNDLISRKWPELVRAWNERFFSDVEKANTVESRHSEADLIGYHYTFDTAYVISPRVPVALAASDPRQADYPTEAILNTMRVAKRDLLGIVINRKNDHQGHSIFRPYGSNFTDEKKPEVNYDVFSDESRKREAERVNSLDYVQWLKDTHFNIPDSDEEILTVAGHLSKYAGSQFTDFLRSTHEVSDEWINNAVEMVDKPFKERKKFPDAELKIVADLTRSYITEHSPVKQGEPLWNGIIRAAEALKVPIYDTKGNILWPEVTKSKG